MRPDQFPLLPRVGAPSVHPDGGWAVVSVTHPSFEADDYVGQLWRVPLTAPDQAASQEGDQRDTAARRITRGFADTAPRISPDGTLIAFLRRLPGHRAQLALVDAGGGEPWIITSFTQGVSEFSWSPDSRHIVLSARVPDPGRYGSVRGIDAEHEDPRHLTGLKLRHNGMGAGWYADRPLQLFLLDVPDPEEEPAVPPAGRGAIGLPLDAVPGVASFRPLTDDHADWTSPVVDLDGSVLACRETPASGMITTLMRIDPGDGTDSAGGCAEPSRVPGSDRLEADGQTHRVSIGSVAVVDDPDRADGATIPRIMVSFADLGPRGDDPAGTNTQVGVLGPHGLVPLSDPDCSLNHELSPTPTGVLVTDSFRGRGRVHLVSPVGPQHDTVLVDAEMVAGAAAAVPGTRRIVVSAVRPDSPGELMLAGPDGLRVLTDLGRDLRDAAPTVRPEEFTAGAPDGYPVHGWILTPDQQGPHPVILMIHGGPHSQYTGSFLDDFQAMVTAGYAVVACNPRGSAGYGRDHARALVGRFGDVDAGDVLAFLDAALAARPDLDAGRLGIMGGSYGGYLTAWIIGHDHRWRGAIVERGYLDPISFIGASDIGWYYPDVYNGTDPGRVEAQSAMRWAEQVTTPTLVIHSEQDLRTPLSQGLEYHARLTRAGVDTELLVFPGENHELSRSGTPWHRRQRLEAILDFWDRHLR